MRKKVFILGLMAVVAAAWAAPSFAARAVQGAVGEVSAADGGALGPVGFRFWSALNPDPDGTIDPINNNQPACRNIRCIKNFITNVSLSTPGAIGGGGYAGGAEATNAYNGDANDQPFYQLVDASMNAGAGNHIGYYGTQGVTGNAAGVGDFLAQDCGIAGARNCMGRIDIADGAPALTSTRHSFGGTNSIRSIGGLSPIPNVRVTGVTGNIAHLAWVNPVDYQANMRPSSTGAAPGSPIKGVSLWKVDKTPCVDPLASEYVTQVATDNVGGSHTFDDDLSVGPASDCRFYALKVRLIGQAGGEISTFEVGVNSQAVSRSQTAVRITRFNAQYAGHGVVNVSWQSGVEGDIRGFKVTRGVTSTGPFVAVSDTVPAAGDGHVYSVTDSVKAGAGKTYYYQLQIVARDGSITTSAPAAVTLPARSKKNPAIR